LFLNVAQIITKPDASGFMIGMLHKEAEEKNASNEQKHHNTLRLVSVFVVPALQRRLAGKTSRMID